jgi:hypothetical protein
MRLFGKILVDRVRLQMTIWRVRVACWTPKTTNAHSELRLSFTARQATDDNMAHTHYMLYN